MKFYDRVLNQDIKKCRVMARGKLFFVWTQRPLLKIINSIKSKLLGKLSNAIGEHFEKDIADALEDEDIVQNIKEMVENQHIDLIDEDNTPFLQKQLTDLQNENAGESQVNIRLSSPTMQKLDNAEL
jgi:hypothetical protein